MFTYIGTMDALADKHGAIHFGAKLRKLWPGKTLWATVDLVKHGTCIACYASLPDQDAYRKHRRERYERLLVRKGIDHSTAYRTACIEITTHINFSPVPIKKNNYVQLGNLLRTTQMRNPLIWTGLPDFSGIEGVLLQQQSDFDQLVKQFREEYQNPRLFGIPPEH